MGIFKKKKYASVDKNLNNGRVRINMTRASVCRDDDAYRPHKAIIGIDNTGSLRDFINILLKRYCPRIKGMTVIWVLSYNNKPLAVFNGGTGTINILNDKTAALSIEEIVKGDDNPSMFLHYIGQNAIEEVANTMLKQS